MAKKKKVEVEPVEHSPKFELVKSYYDAGLWKKKAVRNAVLDHSSRVRRDHRRDL